MKRRFHVPRDLLGAVLPYTPRKGVAISANVGPKVARQLEALRRSDPKAYARLVMRYKRYKYLGDEVVDRGRPGLDSITEWRRIKSAIIEDYRAGRIDVRTARGRLLLLRLLLKRHLLAKKLISKQEYKEGLREWREAWGEL